MAFSVDPQTLGGGLVESITNITMPIIVGMSSDIAPVPNFIIAVIPNEEASGSTELSSLQLNPGNLLLKSAVNPGQYRISIALSDQVNFPSAWFQYVATALQQISAVSNSIANYGAILPNISGISANFVASQLSTLFAMKNGMQPIMILNSYILLGSISQTSPYLTSNWYIDNIDILKEEAEGGLVVQVSLKELLTKGNVLQSAVNAVSNIGGRVLSPIAGTLLEGVLATSNATLLQ